MSRPSEQRGPELAVVFVPLVAFVVVLAIANLWLWRSLWVRH